MWVYPSHTDVVFDPLRLFFRNDDITIVSFFLRIPRMKTGLEYCFSITCILDIWLLVYNIHKYCFGQDWYKLFLPKSLDVPHDNVSQNVQIC